MMNRSILVLAALVYATCDATQQFTYTSGSKEVIFSLDYLDDNGSTLACVNLTKGFDAGAYEEACFGRKLNERGIFQGCEISFDGARCNKCEPCVVSGEVGFTIDCFNIQPQKNKLLCEQFKNETVQELLAGESFVSSTFDFALNTTAPKNTTSNGSGSGNGSSDANFVSSTSQRFRTILYVCLSAVATLLL
jgi:hypothetical protein